MTVTFEVLDSQWSADGDVFAGGTHEVAKPTAAFLRLLGSAHAAGAVRIDGEPTDKMVGHIESQEDGEAAYQAAQEDGRWHEGNLEQFELDVASGVRTDTIGGDA